MDVLEIIFVEKSPKNRFLSAGVNRNAINDVRYKNIIKIAPNGKK